MASIVAGQTGNDYCPVKRTVFTRNEQRMSPPYHQGKHLAEKISRIRCAAYQYYFRNPDHG